MVALVFVIFTIAQYIVSWAVYAEKKYTAVSLTFTHEKMVEHFFLVLFEEFFRLQY